MRQRTRITGQWCPTGGRFGSRSSCQPKRWPGSPVFTRYKIWLICPDNPPGRSGSPVNDVHPVADLVHLALVSTQKSVWLSCCCCSTVHQDVFLLAGSQPLSAGDLPREGVPPHRVRLGKWSQTRSARDCVTWREVLCPSWGLCGVTETPLWGVGPGSNRSESHPHTCPDPPPGQGTERAGDCPY